MDNKARPHRALLVDEFLESEDIHRMDWPGRDSDLSNLADNPVEIGIHSHTSQTIYGRHDPHGMRKRHLENHHHTHCRCLIKCVHDQFPCISFPGNMECFPEILIDQKRGKKLL
ncbi:hypothetical protein TNCV_1649101 [Trichonephila clavipes]|nr:hypothetical protein TNCV_1649101 [Trichonephila clavipes]